MHEMALAEGVLAVVLDAAEGEAVRRVRLSVGVLQAVVPESFRFSFGLAAENTVAADAVVELAEVLGRLRCRDCGSESEFATPPLSCRHCGASDVELLAGDELVVDAIELASGWRYRPDADDGDPAAVAVPASHLADHAGEAAGPHGPAGPA